MSYGMYRFPNEPGQPPAAPDHRDVRPYVSPRHLVHLLKAQPPLALPRSVLHSIVKVCERAKSDSPENRSELDEVIHMCQHQLDTGLTPEQSAALKAAKAEHAAEENLVAVRRLFQ